MLVSGFDYVLGFSRETEPVDYISIKLRKLFKLLAHVTKDAERSLGLPSASWRLRKASGIVQFESEGLRTRKAESVSLSLRAGDRCPSHERTNSSFLHFLLYSD